MARCGRYGWLLAMLWVGSAWAQVPNPVTNGGFEQLGPDGFPIDWGPVGETVEVTGDAHQGEWALRLLRSAGTPAVETGLNRDWRPDSGARGAQLEFTRGALLFWYQAISSQGADLNLYAIPMSARPYEDTGEARATFTVPPHHIGDGEWHRGVLKFDFSANPRVRYVQISPRIVGSAGELLLDDIEFAPRLGPWIRVEQVRIEEDSQRPGSRCAVVAQVRNVGDAPLAGATARLAVEPGLRLAGAPTQSLPSLAPDAAGELHWTVIGDRTGPGVFQVAAASGDQIDENLVGYRPELQLLMLEPERFIVSPGEEVELRCWLRNAGHAIVTDLEAELEARRLQILDGEVKRRPRFPPQATIPLRWRVQLDQLAPAATRVQVRSGNAGGGEREARLLATRPFPLLPVTARFGAQVADEYALLQNENLRLIFPRNPFGFGIGEIRVRQGRAWVTAGRLPALGRIVLLTDNGTRQEQGLFTQEVRALAPERPGEPAGLRFRIQQPDADGARWEVTVDFTLGSDEVVIDTHHVAHCDRPRRLLVFEGPMIYAGEGSFGSRKQEAIFPGLEWLEEGEVSSSDLDIARDHPDRLRYVPHPYKITFPAMGVHTGGVTVGLLWDVHQRWNGLHERPAAVFASPDYFEGRNAHLMGLFAPSAPDWVPENGREASTPYAWDAEAPLELRAGVVADGRARDALAVVDAWLVRYGIPEPMPYPRGSRRAEIAFSMRAYLESLWNAETREWWSSKNGHPLMSSLTRPPSYLYDLWMGRLLAADPALRARCDERLELMTPLVGPPLADDLGFDFRGPSESVLGGLMSQAAALLASQGPQGEWRFDADRQDQGVFKGLDYHRLGADDAVELGTCARNAYDLLRFGRLTGDARSLEAGEKALRFMERFRVPRAAQVWEVPVHTPDILAAADAVEAYLEGYRWSANPHQLEQAVRWARKGLPFLYAWNTPDRPFLRYASIPVFGATWFQGSWFGRPVQWNGLRYAYAVWKLAQALREAAPAATDLYHDPATWETIAEGVTVSACYQQDAEGEDVALWPDAISAIDGSKVAWVFAPRMILANLYALLGRDGAPHTHILEQPATRVPITCGGEVVGAGMNRDELSCTVRFPADQSGFVMAPSARAPTEVEANGRALSPLATTAALQTEEGWLYDADRQMLIVRLTRDGEHQLAVRPFQPMRMPQLLPAPRDAIDFGFEQDAEGWTAAHHLQDLRQEGGHLQGRITGGDPYLVRPLLRVAPDRVTRIRLRLRVTGNGNGQFYWTTQSSPGFAEDKVMLFTVEADGEFHEVVLPVGEHPLWRGQRITAVRLDPNNGAPGSEFALEEMRGEQGGA